MNPPLTLTGSHLRTWQRLFQHPVAHNLGWQDVHALLRQLGQVEEQPNSSLKVSCNGQLIVLHPSRTKDVAETDELMALRHFLERSAAAPPGNEGKETHWLLVIDHHEARIYRSEMAGTVPERLLPHEPDDFFRHAHHSKDFSRGMEKPDPNTFFEPVARALQAATHVLIFGRGTGMSSEMDQFTGWLKIHHAGLAARIIGTRVVDDHHLTEAQLLATAREFYAKNPVTGA